MNEINTKILSALRHGRMTVEEIITVTKGNEDDTNYALQALETIGFTQRFSNDNVLWGLSPVGWDYVRSEL